MKPVVADASVVVKWVLPARDDERDWPQALGLLEGIKSEQFGLVQPPHCKL